MLIVRYLTVPTPDELTASPRTTTPNAEDATVWLVSYGEQDDRELKPPEIAESLRRGEITAKTIVWREGLADWKPLSEVPSLARLLASSGETAALPPAAPMPVKSAEPARVSPPQAPKTDAKPGGAAQAATWKGSTRIGLPKPGAKPGAAAPDAATATPPADRSAAKKPEPKKLEFKKVTPKAAQPKTADTTPTTPLAGGKGSAQFAAAAAVKPGLAAPSPREETPTLRSAEDEEPISVDPESLRPPSPSPLARATALSPGTLAGGARKPAPKPPTPKRPPSPAATPSPAPADDDAPDSLTPGLHALAAPLTAVTRGRADDDILNLGGGQSGVLLAAPTIDFTSALTSEPVPEPEGTQGGFGAPLLEVPDGDMAAVPDTTPTVPMAGGAAGARATAGAPGAAASPSPGSSARATGEKKRSVIPFFLGGVAVVLALTVALRGTGRHEPAASEEAPTHAEVAAPPPPAPAPAPVPEDPARAAPAPEATTEVAAAAAPSPAASPVAAAEAPVKAAAASPVKAAAEKPAGTPAPSPKPETAAATTPKADAPKAAATKAAAAAADDAVAEGGEFDKAAAATALGAAADQASGCRKDGDPSGVATVHVTFSNSGRATRATIEGPPFAGTPTGGCIAAALRGAKVPPFGGDRVTVTKRVVIR